jgi:hypothetical protein
MIIKSLVPTKLPTLTQTADNVVEQGLDLRNNANNTLPYWLLPNLSIRALKASFHPEAILFLPSTDCMADNPPDPH